MKKIIIDTDIGDDIDDAFALLCALAQPRLEIVGITTVFKNTPQRARIVKSLLRAAGREDIPVYAGIETPTNGKIEKWNYERLAQDGKIRIHHYRDEMEKETYCEGKAEDFILETAAKYPHEVTLVAIGPFTNVAAALHKDREKFMLLKEAYIMAGHPFSPYREWNVRVDPVAASDFFSSGLPITCLGLNVTTLCKLYDKQIALVDAFSAPAVRAVDAMMHIWIESNNSSENGEKRYPTMHDPLCMLSLVHEEICEFRKMKIKVDTESEKSGITAQSEEGAPMRLAVSADVDKFYESFFSALGRIKKVD